MPGVMMIEALVQVATLLLLDDTKDVPTARAMLRGVDNAKFRRQVVPGDRLFLEVTLKGESKGVSITLFPLKYLVIYQLNKMFQIKMTAAL